MKDREKEEYTSEILREKGSVAERPFDRKDVEGSFGVVMPKSVPLGFLCK